MLPDAALMVVEPKATAVASPPAAMVAIDGTAEFHATGVARY